MKTVRVLVVDDDPVMRELVMDVVKALGYRVSGVGNGEKALNFIRTGGDVDAIITDFHMPVMDGEALTRHVKRCIQCETKVVFMSAAHVDEFRAIAEAAGADEVLEKSDIARRLPEILKSMFGSPNPIGDLLK